VVEGSVVTLRYLSVCSGIEAATVAWHPLGWEPVAFSEIEPFPSAVLAHHYPTVPNLGDMTKFQEWPDESIDLLVGGTPCQSFSVAGLRKGLEDPRGNLMLTYLAIARRYRPRWLVWENVPGVLSSNGGRDFGAFLGALGELGYGWAYRVLDAQWFGVAQRRRRVFVVGYLGDWQRAAQVLFERESVRRDNPPSREARQGAAASVGGGVASGGVPDVARSVAFVDVGATLKGGSGARGYPDPSDGNGHNMVAQPVAFHNRQDPDVSGDITHPLGAKDNEMAVAQPVAIGLDEEQNACVEGFGTLKARMEGGGFEGSVMTPAMQVRRLTPTECERLQGFHDGYTNIPWRKKPEAPDGPRYKALGNSMAVPCMAWIGKRIAEVDRGD